MFLDLHTECSVNVLLVDSGVKITPGVIFRVKITLVFLLHQLY